MHNTKNNDRRRRTSMRARSPSAAVVGTLRCVRSSNESHTHTKETHRIRRSAIGRWRHYLLPCMHVSIDPLKIQKNGGTDHFLHRGPDSSGVPTRMNLERTLLLAEENQQIRFDPGDMTARHPGRPGRSARQPREGQRGDVVAGQQFDDPRSADIRIRGARVGV